MNRLWTKAEKQVLIENYKKLSYAEIAELLGRTADQVKNAASRYKITSSRAWPCGEMQLLRELYPDTPTNEIAERLARPVATIYSMAKKFGLKKSEAFLASDASGRMHKGNSIRYGEESRFRKGHIPANKGLRRPGYAPGRMSETQFKKGHLNGAAAEKVQPIGAERITTDGYLRRKVNNDRPWHRRWQLVQRIVWEEHHGPIPKGCNIAFRDGDKSNFAIDNLECVSRVEWMKRHTMHNYPEPVREAIHTIIGFKRRLNCYGKKQASRPAEPALRDDGAAA